MMLSSIKKICSFFKERKRARNIFIVFVTLSNLNKTSHRTRAAVQLFKEHDWESVFVKLHFCIDPMTILVSHQAAPPTFYNKIAPMLGFTTDCFETRMTSILVQRFKLA